MRERETDRYNQRFPVPGIPMSDLLNQSKNLSELELCFYRQKTTFSAALIRALKNSPFGVGSIFFPPAISSFFTCYHN